MLISLKLITGRTRGGAFLILPENEAYPNEDLGRVFCLLIFV